MKRSKPAKHPYRKIILGLSILLAIVGGVTSLIILLQMTSDQIASTRRPLRVLLAPLSFTFLGYLIGTAIGVVFAPTSFLESRDGEKWLKLVGTSNTMAARIVSAVVLFCVVGGLGLLAYFIFR